MDLITILLAASVALMIFANIRVVRCSKIRPTRISFLLSFLSSVAALCVFLSMEFSILMKFMLGIAAVMVLFNYTSFRSYNYVMSRRLKSHVWTEKMKKYREYVMRSIMYYLLMSLVIFKYYCFKVYDMDVYLIGILGIQKVVSLCIAFVIVLSFVLLQIFKNRFFEKGSVSEKKLLGLHNLFQLIMYTAAYAYAYFSTSGSGHEGALSLLLVYFFTMLTCAMSTAFLSRFMTKSIDETGNKFSLYVDVVNFLTLVPSLLYLVFFF